MQNKDRDCYTSSISPPKLHTRPVEETPSCNAQGHVVDCPGKGLGEEECRPCNTAHKERHPTSTHLALHTGITIFEESAATSNCGKISKSLDSNYKL